MEYDLDGEYISPGDVNNIVDNLIFDENIIEFDYPPTRGVSKVEIEINFFSRSDVYGRYTIMA